MTPAHINEKISKTSIKGGFVIKINHARRIGRGIATLMAGLALAMAAQAEDFSAQVPEGDYRVRLRLASGAHPTRAVVWAEERRLMRAPVSLNPHETREISFIVNTRRPFLDKAEQDAVDAPKVGLRGEEIGGRSWDDALSVTVSGTAQAQLLGVEPVSVRRVLLAGDSTVTDQGGGDYASWGQMLPRFLSDDVSVANHARSGETMKSFVATLRWDKLLSQAREGDIVLIQFGHNDQKKQWPRTYVDAAQAYPAWLKAFAADVQARGAEVVLVTPVARRVFKDGRIENTHQGYDQAVRDVAAELGVPLIDLTLATTRFYEALGPESPLAFGAGGEDKTHHNAYGAWVIANYVAAALVTQLGLEAAEDFVAFDPSRPADPRHFELSLADWPSAKPVTLSGN